jgi:hypothetical protein
VAGSASFDKTTTIHKRDSHFVGAVYDACVFSTLTSHKGIAMIRQFALSAMALQG